jgi:hypothetical protein
MVLRRLGEETDIRFWSAIASDALHASTIQSDQRVNDVMNIRCGGLDDKGLSG